MPDPPANGGGWTADRARRVLADIFEADPTDPTDAATPEEVTRWLAPPALTSEQEAAAEARREDFACYLDELGFPGEAARLRHGGSSPAADWNWHRV